MNDNDYSVASGPFPGLLPIPGFPISWNGCFGGYNGTGFCENIDSDRTYEFAVVETYGRQFEVSLISDFDGPLITHLVLILLMLKIITCIKFKQQHGI
jgi:hypothetical protein